MFLRLNYSTFPFIQKYPLFHYFSIMLERIALLYYFRWLVESLISYFDIFHSWNIYVNGFNKPESDFKNVSVIRVKFAHKTF